jgi:phage gpG-like protein
VPKVRDIKEMADYIKRVKKDLRRASLLTLVELAQYAQVEAIRNVKRNFGGRGHKLTGQLMNSIYYEFEGTVKPVAYLGTRGIPYGRIHELGGTIKPRAANWLWQPMPEKKGRFKRLTPSEFYKNYTKRGSRYGFINTRDNKGHLAIYEQKPGPDDVVRFKVLFMLRKKVNIKKRPYLRPAVEAALERYAPTYIKHFKHETQKAR